MKTHASPSPSTPLVTGRAQQDCHASATGPGTAALTAALAGVLLLAACATPPPPPKPVGITDLTARPAESALLQGLRLYDDGQYADAETQLKAALADGLVSVHDQAAAHKTLAFIYCTSNREQACADEFTAAKNADPGFALSKAEAGHPIWGPVYRRVVPAAPAAAASGAAASP